MLRLFVAVVVASLTACGASLPESVSTTRLTASGAWDRAHAELFTVETPSGRVHGEILWPSKIEGASPPLVILVNGASQDAFTTLAMSLAESGVATLRYTDRVAIDDEIVAASVKILRRDPRVRRIALATDAEHAFAAVDVDDRIVLSRGAAASDVLGSRADFRK